MNRGTVSSDEDLLHSQAFPPFSFGSLPVCKNWMVGRPGNKANLQRMQWKLTSPSIASWFLSPHAEFYLKSDYKPFSVYTKHSYGCALRKSAVHM